MDIVDAIDKRRSIRSFKLDPIPVDILKGIVGGALRAPSASNSQPWEFAVVTGPKLEQIKQACVERSNTVPNMDIPIPFQYPEPWAGRRRAVMAGVLAKLGIAREDKQKRMEWGLQGFRLWGAPACIYVMIERSFYQGEQGGNLWNIFDCGLVVDNILLLATSFGLGTIPAIMPVLYPDILRKTLGLPDSKLMVIGIAVGYADENNPVNQFRTEREPLDKVARFYE